MRFQTTVALLALSTTALSLGGCNRHELFRLAGYEQASFRNEADVLFIADNSVSMWDESAEVGLNFNVFIESLVDPETGTGMSTDGISDAVDNYIQYSMDRGRFIDYRLAVTTTGVDPDGDVTPGTLGTFVRDPVHKGDEGLEELFLQTVLCDATCWPKICDGTTDDCIPHDPEYACGDPIPDDISIEYLRCLCGDGWDYPDCGSGTEEGLEAGFLALCRAVEDPPPACFEVCEENAYGKPYCRDSTRFTEAEVMTNPDFVREGSTVIIVIVTDEGDSSYPLSQGDSDPSYYLDGFAEFDNRVSIVVVGPNYDPESRAMVCNSGNATTWGTIRYQEAAAMSGGFYRPIAAMDAGEECRITNFAEHFTDLGNLLNSLLNLFPLQSIPDPDTILVYVDDVLIPEAACTANCDVDSSSEAVWDNGWSYAPGENAVEFHGNAVPDYNAQVRIYYRPISELPRNLPI